jgi:hypothetical protein
VLQQYYSTTGLTAAKAAAIITAAPSKTPTGRSRVHAESTQHAMQHAMQDAMQDAIQHAMQHAMHATRHAMHAMQQCTPPTQPQKEQDAAAAVSSHIRCGLHYYTTVQSVPMREGFQHSE